MKKKHEQFVRIAAFLLIGVALFWVVQAVLTPDWVWPQVKESSYNSFEELYELKGHDIQALFIGKSHNEYGIDPMRIYEKSGITTFNLATPIQPNKISYCLVKEMFKSSIPRYVFFDATGLLYDASQDAHYRYIIDGMHFSSNKIELAQTYMKIYPKEKQLGAFLSAFFPIYSYHDRWDELRKHDYHIVEPKREYVLKGYYMDPRVKSSTITLDKVNSVAQINATAEGWIEQIEDGQITRTSVDGMVYAPEVNQDALNELIRVHELCEDYGVQLQLIELPACIKPQNDNSWTKIKYDMVKNISAEYGIPYIDLTYDVDLGMDWSTDTLDNGGHLNYSGAKKVADFLAEYLQTECGLEGHYDAEYEEDLPMYHALCAAAELQITSDLSTYLMRVSELEDATVFFSVMDDMMSNLSEENRQDLKDFGLQTDFHKLEYSDSYLAVKEGETVLYEASGNRLLSKSGTLHNGVSYTVTSCGWRAGAESSITLEGEEYSMNNRGINIVVLDNRSKQVLDSVVFDTWNSGSQAGVRNMTSSKKYTPMGSTPGQAYFFNYEDFLLKNGL